MLALAAVAVTWDMDNSTMKSGSFLKMRIEVSLTWSLDKQAHLFEYVIVLYHMTSLLLCVICTSVLNSYKKWNSHFVTGNKL